MELFATYFFLGSILRHFWVILGPWVQLKSPEISTNTSRTKLILCELNSMGNNLKIKYIIGACQILQKKRLI